MSGEFVVHMPVAVARAVMASQWMAGQPQPIERSGAGIPSAFKRALDSKWARRMLVGSVEQLEAWRTPIKATLDEMLAAKAARTKWAPVQSVLDELELLRPEVEKHLVKIAEEEAARTDRMRAENRRARTIRRAKTMSGQIEAGRNRQLREICEDFDLDFTLPDVKRALISAYHAGAVKVNEVMQGVMVVDPIPIDDDEWKTFRERDRKLFAGADVDTDGWG